MAFQKEQTADTKDQIQHACRLLLSLNNNTTIYDPYDNRKELRPSDHKRKKHLHNFKKQTQNILFTQEFVFLLWTYKKQFQDLPPMNGGA